MPIPGCHTLKCALPEPQLVPEDGGKLRVELQKQHEGPSRKGMHRAVTLESQEKLTPKWARGGLSLICHLSVPREAGPELLGQLFWGTFLYLHSSILEEEAGSCLTGYHNTHHRDEVPGSLTLEGHRVSS